MLSKTEILSLGKSTISLEAKALANLEQLLNDSFSEVVLQILNSDGRIAITGIGKSAIVAQKIAATFNSTGTPSFFMHAADAIHGDLGMIQKNDIVICISKSGNSPEIKALTPIIKSNNNILVAMVGDIDSFLGVEANLVLNTFVEKEAGPNNLAPTTSTTAQMAMGDALAVALITCRNFGEKDFAKYHPGGSLGKKLYLQLEDLAKNKEEYISPTLSAMDALLAISKSRLGAIVVLKEDKTIVGVITDGDIRRSLAQGSDLKLLEAQDIMTASPKTLPNSMLARNGASFLKQHKINHIILEDNQRYAGIVHIQDLMSEGLT